MYQVQCTSDLQFETGSKPDAKKGLISVSPLCWSRLSVKVRMVVIVNIVLKYRWFYRAAQYSHWVKTMKNNEKSCNAWLDWPMAIRAKSGIAVKIAELWWCTIAHPREKNTAKMMPCTAESALCSVFCSRIRNTAKHFLKKQGKEVWIRFVFFNPPVL